MKSDLSNKNKIKSFNSLLKKIKRNPEEGLREFHVRYSKKITAVAFSICKNQNDADEVLQNVLIKILNFAKDPKSVDNPDGWIYSITLNTARDMIKQSPFVELNEQTPVFEEGFDKIEGELHFYRLIEGLSEEEKQIVLLKFVWACTFTEIAQYLKKPISTVTNVYYRALQKIEEKLR